MRAISKSDRQNRKLSRFSSLLAKIREYEAEGLTMKSFGGEYKKTVKKAKETAGKPVYIMDWEKGRPIKFESLLITSGTKHH